MYIHITQCGLDDFVIFLVVIVIVIRVHIMYVFLCFEQLAKSRCASLCMFFYIIISRLSSSS